MKHLAILLCLTLCFGLFACTNNTDDGKVPEDENANGGEEITENGTNDSENNTNDGKVPEDENANGGEEITENGTNDSENTENEDKEEVVTVNVDYKNVNYKKISECEDGLTFMGRNTYLEDGGVKCSWSYSGFEVSGWFTGDFKVYYSVPEGVNNLHLQVTFDNDMDSSKFISLSPDRDCFAVTLPKKGYQTITVSRTEDMRAKPVTFNAVEYYGKIDTEPLPKTLNIEVVGDSISCGTGIISPNGLNDDAYYSYGALLARKLHGKLNIIAIPGWSLSKGIDLGESTLMPAIWPMTASRADDSSEWDFANNQMDIVIVNLGTNDWTAYHNTDRTELKADMSDFIDDLREAYPDAYIYWTYGMMNTVFLDDFKGVIAEKNDPKLSFVDVFLNGEGGGNHPDMDAHAEYAFLFERAIRKDIKLGAKTSAVDKFIEAKLAVQVIEE